MSEGELISADSLTSVDIADAILVASAHHTLRGMAVTNGETMTIIEALELGRRRHMATVPSPVGQAVVARFALLVGLDGPGGQGGIGRLRVTLGNAELEFMVDVGSGREGLSGVEVLRLSSPPLLSADAMGCTSASSMMAPYPYRVDGELGHGGMGVVYKAFHESLQRPVAIKVLHTSRAQSGADCFRFLREARAASRVRHPGIVSILDFGSLLDGRGFMVMELVEASTLRRVLDDGPLDPRRAIRVLASMACAVEAAHQEGVVHRDLKPENVFVLRDDQVKVVDFGAAKLLIPSTPGDTADGRVFGTPRYMAPEHAWGEPTDTRTDVYALGCILYEMTCGKPPYDGNHVAEIMMRHANDPIPEIQLDNTALGREVNAIIRRAMAKRPKDRYATAHELEFALRAALDDRRPWWKLWRNQGD